MKVQLLNDILALYTALSILGTVMYFILWQALKKGKGDLLAGRNLGPLVRLYLARRDQSLSTSDFLRVHQRRCMIAWMCFLVGLIICSTIWAIIGAFPVPHIPVWLLARIALGGITACVSALTGFLVARQKNRSACVWGLMCFFFLPLLIVLLFLSDKNSVGEPNERAQ